MPLVAILRQFDRELTSLSDLALGRTRAAVGFDDLLYEGEAKAVAMDLGVDDFLRPIERLEYVPQVAFRDTDAVVFDR